MFQQSAKVHLQTSPLRKSNKQSNDKKIVQTMFASFSSYGRYDWSVQIPLKFKEYLLKYFPAIWQVDQQQFYESLIVKCGIQVKREQVSKFGYKKCFYESPLMKNVVTLPDSFLQDINIRNHVFNVSILQQNLQQNNFMPLIVQPKSQSQQNQRIKQANKSQQKQLLTQRYIQQQQIQLEQYNKTIKQEYQLQMKIKRIQKSSLILPETVFTQKLSNQTASRIQLLVIFYRKLQHCFQQILYSNNIISFPIKHFIISFEDKVNKKRIKNKLPNQILLGINQDARRARKRRQNNKNLVLQQIRDFLLSYTQFIWIFLQLHKVKGTMLQLFVEPYLIYGCLFKALWRYFDWVAESGFEFEEHLLYEYINRNKGFTQRQLSQANLLKYSQILLKTKNELNPQYYLRYILLLYRQISSSSQNADDLLCKFQQVLIYCLQKDQNLHIFRMKNIVERLLRLEESEIGGGQIGYCWTTWTILLQILKQKSSFKYGSLMISLRKDSNQPQQFQKNTKQQIQK